MTKKEKFTIEELYKLGNGDEHLCTYDFSEIPAKYYEKFFWPLSNLVYKKVDELRFNCNLAMQEETSLNKNRQKQRIIEQSIYHQRPNYLNYLCVILKEVLPKAKRIKRIRLSDMNIPSENLSELFDALETNNSPLELLSFQNIKIETDKFNKNIQKLDPYNFAAVEFINCGLTNDNIEAIRKFITRPPKDPENWSAERALHTLDLSQNNITEEERKKLQKLIEEERAKWLAFQKQKSDEIKRLEEERLAAIEAEKERQRRAKERAEQRAREKAEREAREKAEKERLEREAKEKAEREKKEKERLEREAKEKAEREKKEKERLEREAKEKAEREKKEKERLEREAKEKTERERKEKEKREKEHKQPENKDKNDKEEREKLERERKEREEKERREKEKKERLERERKEKEEKERRERLERDSKEKTDKDAERLKKKKAKRERRRDLARKSKELGDKEDERFAEELKERLKKDAKRVKKETEIVELEPELEPPSSDGNYCDIEIIQYVDVYEYTDESENENDFEEKLKKDNKPKVLFDDAAIKKSYSSASSDYYSYDYSDSQVSEKEEIKVDENIKSDNEEMKINLDNNEKVETNSGSYSESDNQPKIEENNSADYSISQGEENNNSSVYSIDNDSSAIGDVDAKSESLNMDDKNSSRSYELSNENGSEKNSNPGSNSDSDSLQLTSDSGPHQLSKSSSDDDDNDELIDFGDRVSV